MKSDRTRRRFDSDTNRAGTPAYMAPECFLYDYCPLEIDIWSMAVCLGELKAPFGQKDVFGQKAVFGQEAVFGQKVNSSGDAFGPAAVDKSRGPRRRRLSSFQAGKIQ